MNKKTLTEADIRTKFITPALAGENCAKWVLMTQIREEVYFTKGRGAVSHGMVVVLCFLHRHPHKSPGKPIRIEEFEAERAWWGNEKGRFQIPCRKRACLARFHRHDQGEPFQPRHQKSAQSDEGPGDVDHLLPEYEKLLAQIAETRGKLKTQLMEALTK